MKYILIGLILSLNVSAVTFEKYRTTADGVSSQKFVLSETEATLEKTSNYFDLKPKDYGIGILKLQAITDEYKKTVKQIEEYEAKFKVVDDFLKTKGSDFNTVSGVVKHEPIIIVGDYKLKPDSKYYAELDALFKKLRALDWKLVKGYKVTEDLEKVLEIDNGKTVKTKQFARGLYCKSQQLPTTCTYYGGGQLFVE